MPLLIRQSVAWVFWLETDQLVKTFVRKELNIERTERIPSQYLLAGSFLIAFFGTILIMPFDSIKTHMQKEGRIESQRAALRHVINNHGIRGLFVGWRIRWIGY
jgi:hypothetical protein